MKKVVNGVAYNTGTSTLIAFKDNDPYDGDYGPVTSRLDLMVTRSGAYFFLETGTESRWNEKDGEHKDHDFTILSPLSPDDARKQLGRGEWTLIDERFAEFPEAEADTDMEKGATLYVRMPSTLKARIDEAAKAEGVSANVWAMRCLERCLSTDCKDNTQAAA